MEVNKKGKYRLLSDIKTRTACSIATLEKGTIIYITNVSERVHKVFGPPLLDWIYWELPVEFMGEDDEPIA